VSTVDGAIDKDEPSPAGLVNYCLLRGRNGRIHRDNTTKATVQRIFAVTIHLNAEDYASGDLRFPEFGPNTSRTQGRRGHVLLLAPAGALPVTKAKRDAFLPLLYDEVGAEGICASSPAKSSTKTRLRGVEPRLTD
jgi:hypothetical protein